MDEFKNTISIRWADMDPNFHMRHSCYYDFGSQIRMEYLEKVGLGLKVMEEQHFGPVLFREECVFRREIRFGDEVTINVELTKLKRDFSRFSIQHKFVKADGKLAALLTIDAAWMDTVARKLTSLPENLKAAFEQFPKADNFEWID